MSEEELLSCVTLATRTLCLKQTQMTTVTVQEVLELLETEEEYIQEIHIEPPEPAILSDDSADEDEGDPKISSSEMKFFIAILILSGYNKLPGKRFYWESGGDMQNELVYPAMRRELFVQIMRFIHCADNNKMDPKDRMWKLRPIMEMMKKRFISHFEPEQQLDFDECMVAYYSHQVSAW
ncbi:UNVERIFIED_CONTAM: hypothetical protein FKN15_035645 [Acipenser sinensis]